jgi:ribonuclease D
VSAGPEHRLVEDAAQLDDVVASLLHAPEYAVDTEFHRERTYFPTVALVQIKWADEIALVDPLAVDLRPLAPVLTGPGLAVMHAASQDLEVLQRACGVVPSRLFDTQLAAGFLGFATPSLASLSERILGIELPKASRLTDWLRRPLGDDQQRYAAADVDHLLELTSRLRDELAAVGRLAWAEEECEELRSRGWGPPNPDDAWLRLKEGRALKGKARGVAREVAAWRERRAAEIDQPVRHVLSDLAIVGIATNPPRTVEQLRRVRGLDERLVRGQLGEQLLAAVERGRARPDDPRPPRREEVERDQRPAVALVSAWLSQLGRDLRIDPMLLATRADLGAFLAGDPNARLASGWRRDLLGDPVRRLLEGEFALAFDGNGGLELERRSGEPVTVDLAVPTAPWTAGSGNRSPAAPRVE